MWAPILQKLEGISSVFTKFDAAPQCALWLWKMGLQNTTENSNARRKNTRKGCWSNPHGLSSNAFFHRFEVSRKGAWAQGFFLFCLLTMSGRKKSVHETNLHVNGDEIHITLQDQDVLMFFTALSLFIYVQSILFRQSISMQEWWICFCTDDVQCLNKVLPSQSCFHFSSLIKHSFSLCFAAVFMCFWRFA